MRTLIIYILRMNEEWNIPSIKSDYLEGGGLWLTFSSFWLQNCYRECALFPQIGENNSYFWKCAYYALDCISAWDVHRTLPFSYTGLAPTSLHERSDRGWRVGQNTATSHSAANALVKASLSVPWAWGSYISLPARISCIWSRKLRKIHTSEIQDQSLCLKFPKGDIRGCGALWR